LPVSFPGGFACESPSESRRTGPLVHCDIPGNKITTGCLSIDKNMSEYVDEAHSLNLGTFLARSFAPSYLAEVFDFGLTFGTRPYCRRAHWAKSGILKAPDLASPPAMQDGLLEALHQPLGFHREPSRLSAATASCWLSNPNGTGGKFWDRDPLKRTRLQPQRAAGKGLPLALKVTSSRNLPPSLG